VLHRRASAGLACDGGRRDLLIGQAEAPRLRSVLGGAADRSCAARSLTPTSLGLPETCGGTCDTIALENLAERRRLPRLPPTGRHRRDARSRRSARRLRTCRAPSRAMALGCNRGLVTAIQKAVRKDQKTLEPAVAPMAILTPVDRRADEAPAAVARRHRPPRSIASSRSAATRPAWRGCLFEPGAGSRLPRCRGDRRSRATSPTRCSARTDEPRPGASGRCGGRDDRRSGKHDAERSSPRPGMLSTSIRPPSCVVRRCTMCKPSPTPPIGAPMRAVGLTEHLEDDGQVLLGDADAGVPHRRSYIPPRRSRTTPRPRRSAVNLSAFPTRFFTIDADLPAGRVETIRSGAGSNGAPHRPRAAIALSSVAQLLPERARAGSARRTGRSRTGFEAAQVSVSVASISAC
jgi:hypothetical protein